MTPRLLTPHGLEAGRYRPVRWYWALVWAHGQTANGTSSDEPVAEIVRAGAGGVVVR
jgi:hypothetical protein